MIQDSIQKESHQFNNLTHDEDYGTTQLYQPGRHYGRTIPLGRDANGDPTYMLGPHYYVFFCAFLVSVALSAFLLKQVFPVLPTVWFVIVCTTTGLFLLSYLNIGFSLPGIASEAHQISQDLKANERYCKPCKIIRKKGTVHCYDCDVCIAGHDHHCPWIGKCVGRDNLGAFYTFLFMTFGNLICFLIAAVFGHK